MPGSKYTKNYLEVATHHRFIYLITDFKSALTKHRIIYQLVPPHVHRRNAAERAIQTFKNHFLAGLASTDSTFPISEWDRLLPQAQLTLNLLRNSRVNPKLSSHAYLFGNFNFNASPLAPPGIKIAIHKKPSQRSSWSYLATEGFYVGPSMNHYRCMRCYLPDTRTEIDSDTLQFIPTSVPVPETTT